MSYSRIVRQESSKRKTRAKTRGHQCACSPTCDGRAYGERVYARTHAPPKSKNPKRAWSSDLSDVVCAADGCSKRLANAAVEGGSRYHARECEYPPISAEGQGEPEPALTALIEADIAEARVTDAKGRERADTLSRNAEQERSSERT
jgi:hypothetical protein